MRSRVLLVFLGILSFVMLSPAPTSYAAQRCFTETNQCIDGRIAEFWEQNGGLAVFGFPIGPLEQTTVDGKTFTVQRFERNRLELHPENKRPYDVLLGRLGADRLGQQGRDWFGFAKSGDTGGCRVFAETGHAVCGAILKAWRANGLQIDGKKAVSEAESLALFGMPLSGLMTETLSDGKEYQVQWFERARFELHPENAAPYDVLLGLLGSEMGVPPGTLAIIPTQPTPVRIGPGASYPQFPKIALTFTGLQDIGYTPINFISKWEITRPYAQGLNDGSAELVDTASRRAGLVQLYLHDESFQSPAGSIWGFTSLVTQFSSDSFAETSFANTDITFPGSGQPNFHTLDSGCREKSVAGIDLKGFNRINSIYICGNAVLRVGILGAMSSLAMQSPNNSEIIDVIALNDPKIWMYEHFVWALRN
jgi:hypothetical protein